MTRTRHPGPSRHDVPWASLAMALGVLLIGVGALVMSGLATIGALAPALAVGGFGLIMVAVRRRSPRLGWANGVTLARLVGTSWIAALTCTWLVVGVDGAGVVALVAIAACCLALDGVDGKVARARREASAFGARFDLETDAAMIMILCVAVVAQGSVGWWVLAIGLARYGYWLCSLRIAALNLPVAPSLLRKVVAVSQSVALLLCLALGASGIGPSWLPSLLAALALAGLAWSFVSVTVFQLRASGRGSVYP